MLVACDDDASSDDPAPTTDAMLNRDIVPDMAPMPDAAPVGGVGGEGGVGGAGGEPMGGDGGMGGEGGMDECTPGMQRCLREGDGVLEICQDTDDGGRWSISPCPEGQLCFGGRCEQDPQDCSLGDRTCLTAEQPGICEPGTGFVPGDPCGPEEVCAGAGRCLSRACAQAETRSSYLGCDYLVVNLPNLSHFPVGGGSTPDAPTSVVVTNPDTTRPVQVTLEGFNGDPAPLVAEVTINPPLTAPFAQPETLETQVRDADGMVVQMAFDRAENLEIPPGGLATLHLPRPPAPVETSYIRAEARRVVSDQPVAVYQFNPYCCNFSFSNDASLLLPTSALGTDYMFLGVPSWPRPDDERDPGDPNPPPVGPPYGFPAALVVAASEPGTQVQVDLPEGADIRPIDGAIERQGQRITTTLQANQVLTLQSGDIQLVNGDPIGPDLSGARITTSRPVSVFSSHQCTFYPYDLNACDHLEEQLFPINTWGQEYALVPTAPRSDPSRSEEAVYWKFASQAVATEITLSEPLANLDPKRPGFLGVPYCGDFMVDDRTFSLNEGQVCEFGSAMPVLATSSAPVMVMGIISGQVSTGNNVPDGASAGDPAIFLLPPDRQYRTTYAFLTPDTYARDYVTVVADPDARIDLNGVPVDLANATLVPGSTRVYMHLQIADGPHRIQGNAPFGILVYAFDDYVSYAYTGGLNLEKR